MTSRVYVRWCIRNFPSYDRIAGIYSRKAYAASGLTLIKKETKCGLSGCNGWHGVEGYDLHVQPHHPRKEKTEG